MSIVDSAADRIDSSVPVVVAAGVVVLAGLLDSLDVLVLLSTSAAAFVGVAETHEIHNLANKFMLFFFFLPDVAV
jgi:hypothetical protein